MKRTSLFLALSLFAIVGISGASHQVSHAQVDFTAQEQSWLDSNPTITVGAADWPPYEYVDGNGEVAGITADIAKRFSDVTGSNFVTSSVAGNWTGVIEGLKAGTLGVEFMIENTGPGDADRRGIAYTDVWHSIPTHIIVKDSDRGTITADNWRDEKVVTVDGYAVNTWLAANNIPFTTVPSTAEALRGVADGTYDVHVENWDVAYRIGTDDGITGFANAGLSGHTYKLSIGYTASNAVLGSILQKVLDDIGGDETRTITDSAILRSNADLIKRSFTAAEQAWLNSNPAITVGSADWPPYEYVDDDGDLAGVTADIAKRFSDVTGSNFVKSSAAGDWAATLSGLKDGSVGAEFMIEDSGASDRQGIGFTDAWLYIPTHVIVKIDGGTGADNWRGERVVTVDGYAVNTWLTANNIQFTAVPSTAEALRGVADGTYDAHVENWNVASIVGAQNGIAGLEHAGLSGYTYALSIGYDADNAVLGSILQKVLDGIQGEQQDLIDSAVKRSIGDLTGPARVCR